MLLQSLRPRIHEGQEGRLKDKTSGFLPGLNMNWNGILELPTFIWCNNKDNTKTKSAV